jgi:hypothetical protein
MVSEKSVARGRGLRVWSSNHGREGADVRVTARRGERLRRRPRRRGGGDDRWRRRRWKSAEVLWEVLDFPGMN